MMLSELPDGAYFHPVSLPHRDLQKLWTIKGGAAVLLENLRVTVLSGDVAVVEHARDAKTND